MAALLHVPLQRLKRETTSTEFVQWCHWMDEHEKQPTRDHHYLAQIAAEVRRTITPPKQRAKVQAKGFMLKFTPVTPKPKRPPTQAEIDAIKAVWFARVGYKRKPQDG